MIGFAFTGSFCTIPQALGLMRKQREDGFDILPIFSENVYRTDTRFGKADEIRAQVEKISGRNVIHTIVDAEPIGPKTVLDALIICPCTGNTLAKIANGITDTSVCMAAKAHLRNNRPLIIALATNDALSANLQNIAKLLTRKNVYFVPMRQDDHISKPHSLVADFSQLDDALRLALKGEQIKKIFI